MEELLERAASVLNCSSFDTDRALAAEIRALKKADPQPQVDATVESDAPQGGQGGYKAVGSAPRNIEGPAHLCPKPAPGFELDKRGVLVATDRGPSAPCVARRAVEEIKAIIQKHVPLPGWAYEDEIVRVVRECERKEP